jgi:GT2 family glycosyltransferase
MPVHNRKALTLACLASLQRQSTDDFSVVVIDDGSSDGTSDEIRDRFPKVYLISGTGNLWWSGATNLGIQLAINHGASMLLTLNDDLECDPGYIAALYRAADMHPDCLLGSTSYDLDTGAIVYQGEYINWWLARFDRPGIKYDDNLVEVTHLPGRGMLIPSKIIEQIGMFDERELPHYGADDDYSMRARAAGFRNYCVSGAKIYSRASESGSARLTEKRSVQNYYRHLFGIKGGGNLAVFWKIAWRHCPRLCLPSCLISGLVARIGGYPKAWIAESLARLWKTEVERNDRTG